MFDLARAKMALRSWAKNDSCVKRVMVYGSYCKGTATPSSDLDVAVEIEARPGDLADPPGPDAMPREFTTWIEDAKVWRDQLRQEFGDRLHLEWYDPGGKTFNVERGIGECCIVVYERPDEE